MRACAATGHTSSTRAARSEGTTLLLGRKVAESNRSYISVRHSTRSLRENNSDEHDRCTNHLHGVKRLCKPCPGNERACNAACAQVTKRTYEQEERNDRAEHDHPRREYPDRQMHAFEMSEQRCRPR